MNCPACTAKRLHEPSDWALHPYAGHGFVKEQGWTHPDLTSSAGAATSLRQNLGGDWVTAKAAPVGGKNGE
jgi:hypothetical protein